MNMQSLRTLLGKDASNNGYRTAFKATSLFGGVQVFTILIGIAKSKLVAVWLGTAGYGVMSLFNAGVSLISSLTNLGLQSSAVRDIAAANGENNQTKLAQIVKAVDRWVIATGLLGALLTIALSPWLSAWLFESNKYTMPFVLLSSVVFLNGLYNQHYAILQGTRRLKWMATANIFGAVAGFVCSIPFFYFFRESGIVWALVLTAVSTTIISFLYAQKVKIIRVDQSYRETLKVGINSVKLGIMMSVTVIAVYLVEFILKAYITNSGGIQNVGLYQAGWSLNAQYLGLVFAAMAKDYFPRLSEGADNNAVVAAKMNQQAEITVLILAPMIVVMIVFLSFIIQLLYSGEFVEIVPMTKWLLFGSLIKSGSWAISYI
jgi:O-antigen/teichoic acid export membrane protein